MVDWGVLADTLIIQTFLSAPACTDMVSSKELNSVQKLCGTGFSQFPLLYVVLGPTSL